uniref:DUF7032 domain-containing protein n=1 Tax=Oryza barthii TaxID=65489 RepID=A0A0D3GSD6_9ORYZ
MGEEAATAAAALDAITAHQGQAQLFPYKWQLIRDRLNRLHAGLADIATGGGEGGEGHGALAGVLGAVVETAREASELVPRSQGRHYGGGKLRLRSDLDVVAGTLDALVARVDEVYASGALTRARALVVSRPCAGASRDDVRFYVRDLFARLRVGGAEMRGEAAAALAEVLHDDEKCVRVVVSDVADGVGLTENSDNAWAVAAHGGVTALLNVCADYTASGGELVCAACRVLRSLAGVDEIRKYMVAEAGAAPVLVSLCRGAADEAAQIQAMELLAAIASGDSSVREAVLQEGAVESLVSVLDPASPRSSKAREVALRAIDALCLSSPPSTSRLVAAGFLDRVLVFLRSGDATLQHCALKAAHRLCHASEDTKKAMGDAGFMPELVSILHAAKSIEARDMAAEALCAMVSVHRNRKRFVQEDRNVAQVLQLLGPDDEKLSPAKRFLLSTLMHLSDSTSGRRKIMNLERLAETNVTDAKKIVKKLGGSKLRNIFHGIWSLQKA